jgi:inhibitor of cysteine peptidase
MTFRLSIAAALLLALTGAMPAGAQTMSQSSENIRVSIGATRTITLKENPSTGYQWHINVAQSSNLAAVRISDAGYQAGARHLMGAPGMHLWRVEGRAQGVARIMFDYSRPWEHVAPIRRHAVQVEITQSR